MANAATARIARPAAAPRPVMAGDVVYLEHPDMAHGCRPQMVMAVTETRLLLMPMSSSVCQGCPLPAIDGWHRVTYPAPNRVWAADRAGVAACDARLRRQDVVDLVWAAWAAYEIARPAHARTLARRAGLA